MPDYGYTFNEQMNSENWRENLANIFEEGTNSKVKDSNKLNGLTLEELVGYINLEHNAIDTLTELTDTNISSLTPSDLIYYSGTSWVNSQILPLDFHIQSTSGSREIKIESTSGTTSTQSLKFKQPDIEWKIEHERSSNNSAGLRITDGTNEFKFETTGALKLAGLSSEPNTHNKGSMYYNSTNNNFYVALADTGSTP